VLLTFEQQDDSEQPRKVNHNPSSTTADRLEWCSSFEVKIGEEEHDDRTTDDTGSSWPAKTRSFFNRIESSGNSIDTLRRLD
jgi:hypothetical protein